MKNHSVQGGERDKTSQALGFDGSPEPGGRLDGAAALEKDQEAENEIPNSIAAAFLRDGFGVVRAIWTRPWPDNDNAARRALADACRHADIADIVAGAQAWVAAADAPRFLPALDKWLAAHAWERDPPQRRQARGRYAKADLTALSIAHGRGEMKINTAMWGDGR